MNGSENSDMFEKKVDFYKKKDRDTWLQIRKALAEEGIRHVSAGHYFGDSLAPNGIGGYLDPRNYGANGKIDRDIYYVRVRERKGHAGCTGSNPKTRPHDTNHGLPHGKVRSGGP